MGLQKKIFHPQPKKEPTKEEQKQYDLAWDILCKNGRVCLNDPSKEIDSLKEILQKDPNAFMGAHCDYNGDIPYDEFVKKVLAGEYDRK